MEPLRILTAAEQIAAHLRKEIVQGSLTGEVPGRNQLAALLDVGITSMEEALRLLEKEGLLVAQGAGRTRRVATGKRGFGKPRLRIAVLAYDRFSIAEGIFSETHHMLREAGHDAFFARSTLLELGMDVKRVARLVGRTEADAWIVCAAPRGVNEWFALQAKPAFALFGRRRSIPIASAGVDKSQAIREATRRLLELGHRRIVMMVRPDRRRPAPGEPERAYLATLEEHGIKSAPYFHLPDWDDGKEGFLRCLDSLFHLTPPTALIVDELLLFVTTQHYLARKGLLVPEDVSLVSLETESVFGWCSPAITTIQWERKPVLKRVVAWANQVAAGKKDTLQSNTGATFVEGGTIGPVKS